MLAHGDGPATSPPLAVTFFLAEAGADAGLGRLDPDRDWRELQLGERAWILQSYLRLAAAGVPVALAGTPRPGIVVYHAKQWRELERRLTAPQQSALVAVRGDVRPAPNADFEVVQNPHVARGRRLFVPHWPQAGLVPRDPARGCAVRCAAYKGVRVNLHLELQRPEWTTALADLGVEWVADEVDHRAERHERNALRWPDYSTVDVVVALRPPDRRSYPGKPATKLYNAWLAGVPAVLGPESAYRAERRSSLDYLEAANAAEALAAVARLAGDPGLYQAMVDHGLSRAVAVSPEATTERWRELLFEVLPERIAGPRFRQYRRLPRQSRMAAGRVRRLFGNR